MDQFIYSVLEWLSSLGYFGIALGLMVEVIPSEIVLAYGGFLIASGQINFVGALIAGTIGGVLAQVFLYWIGYYGGRPFLEKYGKYLLIKKKHLDVAESWFDRYGTGVIFGARFIPVVRHAISIPAGISKMPLSRFTLLTTLAIVPWSVLFLYLGMQLGSSWKEIEEIAAPYTDDAAIVAGVLLLLYFLFQWYRKKQRSRNGFSPR
ncbi:MULTISPECIES: DedA family protein [Thermoactinomyces]|uniref:DedA family protein n=1 Tax=Thermoactinomyces daqus TaxID=1329516 RepID=A0A7W1XA49_9BACL|nr:MULTISPECIES: DedA family protein [Thermoactinomyces]MBA4542841.1 DedA family protein [Thermoactinomyces daqus]MBH8598486.1 DedA family protein [Thermoactinomyces sp. CICC 10523]MBH8604669.1 DedA family protein [Thermoactinomyces sp. CICC 10522]MBH8606870.1 DedA family protein [Thermoactinomyces sp. CICC 10521]